MAAAPLWSAMKKYWEDGVYPCHTPGHKGGRGAHPALRELLGDRALAADVSLMSELDDLHRAEGCLKEAQALAARLYGADRSFFAVNGTSGALQALLLGALKPRSKVLIPRNAHCSVAGALVLGDFQPVYLQPGYSKKWGLSLQITPQLLEAALAKQPDIKAVLVTSPNYFGLVAAIPALAEIAHRHKALLLVDEAHGPHLGFSGELPPSALACGADGVAQSTHKLAGALTQCSMLHLKGDRIDQDRVAAAMSMLTTTSPNYLLLASLDLAREQLAEQGAAMGHQAVVAAVQLRQALARVPYIRVLESELIGEGGVAGLDCTKVTVNVTALGVTGIRVAELLRAQGVAVELADRNNILFLVTYADATSEFLTTIEKIVAVLRSCAEESLKPLPMLAAGLPRSLPVLSPQKAFYTEGKDVRFALAAGEIAVEAISFYPPGVPILLPGERITSEIIDYCQMMLGAGVPVIGPKDATLKRIRVMK